MFLAKFLAMWYRYQSHTDTDTSIGTGISTSICRNHHQGICINFQAGMGINMAISVEHYILQKLAKIRLNQDKKNNRV